EARTEHHAELEPLMFEAMKKRTTAEWLHEFDAIGIPCGPLNTIAEAAEHPQVRAREMLVEVDHPVAGKLRLADTPVKLSRTPGGIKGPAPAIGQHTDEVLRELLSTPDAEIARLRESGVLL
ncbi:MAG: CoA transferase, partial [Chloroflexi bacterium]|nr:CoA transferase [Chloroflexota bacterium]